MENYDAERKPDTQILNIVLLHDRPNQTRISENETLHNHKYGWRFFTNPYKINTSIFRSYNHGEEFNINR